MLHNPFRTWEEMRRDIFAAIPDDGKLGRALRFMLDDLADACGGVSDETWLDGLYLHCLECERIYALMSGALDVRRRVEAEVPIDAADTARKPNAAFREYLAKRLTIRDLYYLEADLESLNASFFFFISKGRLEVDLSGNESEDVRVSCMVSYCLGQVRTLRDFAVAAWALCSKCENMAEYSANIITANLREGNTTIAEYAAAARSVQGNAGRLERIEAALDALNDITGALVENRLKALKAQSAAGKAGAKVAKEIRGIDSQRVKIYKAADAQISKGTKTDAAFLDVASQFCVTYAKVKSIYYREKNRRAEEKRGKHNRKGKKRGRYGTIGHEK